MPCFNCVTSSAGRASASTFRPDAERGIRTDAVADTAELFTFYGAMELQGIAPEPFIAEGVKTECLLAFLQ